MRFLIIGCGSAGERHTKNLLSLGQEVFVFDKDLVRAQRLVDTYGVSIYDFKSHHLPIAAFVIATPPNYHIPFAFEALRHDSHIFIEKPISNSLDRVDELITLAKKQDKIIQVGYQLRFNPGLMLVKKILDEGKIGRLLSIRAEFGFYLPYWHHSEDYRNLYTCYESQGGGIILDSSHEIDYVRWLTGSEVTQVSCFADKLSNLEVDVEDTAEINLKFESGAIGNIHVDFIQRDYIRSCKLIGEEDTIGWKLSQYEKDSNIPYLEEMRHFISCIENHENPLVNAETGKRVLEIALAAKQSARENKVIGV